MTSASPAIRRAGPADLDRIAQLEQECFGDTDGVFSRRQLMRLLQNRNAYWILGAEGRAVSCWLAMSNGRARWARLYSMAVHPKLRGQGWGERLLQAGLAWMRTQHLTVCRAEVKVGNHAAHRLYTRFGFREAGRLSDYYGPGMDGLRLIMSVPALNGATGSAALVRPRKRPSGRHPGLFVRDRAKARP